MDIFSNVVINSLISNLSENSIKSFKWGKFISNKKLKKRAVLFYFEKNKIKRIIPKCKNYLQIVKNYPDDVFFSHFRMHRSTFEALRQKLEVIWAKETTGRPGYSLEIGLFLTLWKLGNRLSFRIISDRFNISKGSSHSIFKKTLFCIYSLMKEEIKWPVTMSDQIKIMDGFQNLRKNSFPFVLGCVDGMHINIPTPSQDGISYYNRKGQHSIILQGICDYKFRFLDVFFGYPGSCHDANVWKNSPIGKALSSGTIQLPNNAHLLGDSAYPLTPYLMVPYKDNGHLTREEKKFNYFLSSTRVCIEQTFGILKKKFQILEFVNVRDTNLVKYIVIVCVILHNFIANREKISYDDYDMLSPPENESEDQNHNNKDNANFEIEDGKTKREYLKNLLNSQI